MNGRNRKKFFQVLLCFLPIGTFTYMNTTEHKTRAAELGLEWPAVVALYNELRSLESADVDRRNQFRRDAFKAIAGTAHGGHVKAEFRRAFRDGGDATMVAGIDVAAADRGLDADTLFAELSGDAPGLRPADDVMQEAIDRAAAMAGMVAPGMVPLVHAAAMAGITEQWLRMLVKSGKIDGRKNGRNWIVRLADVQRFSRHPTAGRPRLREHLESAPF